MTGGKICFVRPEVCFSECSLYRKALVDFNYRKTRGYGLLAKSKVLNIKSLLYIYLSFKRINILLSLKSVIKNIIQMHNFYLILRKSSWNLLLLINNRHRILQYACYADQVKKRNSKKKFSANKFFSFSRSFAFRNAADCCFHLYKYAIYPEYPQRISTVENVVSDFIIEIVIISLKCFTSTSGLIEKTRILVVLNSRSQYCTFFATKKSNI